MNTFIKAMKIVLLTTPINGIKKKPAISEPAMEPVVLMKKTLPIFFPKLFTAGEINLQSNGKLIPIHNVGIKAIAEESSRAGKKTRRTGICRKFLIAKRRPGRSLSEWTITIAYMPVII